MAKRKRKPKPKPKPTDLVTRLVDLGNELETMRERLRASERKTQALQTTLDSQRMESADRVGSGLWAKYFVEVCRAADVHLSTDVLMYTEVWRQTLITQCRRLVLLARQALEYEKHVGGRRESLDLTRPKP